MAILDEIDAEIPTTDSWLIAARDAGIPIYVPGWEDSTLGNIFTAHCIKEKSTAIQSRRESIT